MLLIPRRTPVLNHSLHFRTFEMKALLNFDALWIITMATKNKDTLLEVYLKLR